MKRFLTFALSVGFFIWLPSAFADGSGILSLDAPSHIRQTQTPGDDNALLTLRVDNIQVRAEWRVTSAVRVFDIADGVLQLTAAETSGLETQVVTIYVEDKFELLNPSYANLTASAVITVKFESGELELSDAPRLTAVAGKAANLHTFAATGGSEDKIYTLVAGNDAEYFSVGVTSGVLSLSVNAQEGVYVLTVQARDDAGGTAEALATVEVLAALSLATVPPLTVIVGRVAHTLVAGGGIGTYTYVIVSGNKDGFALDAASGVLSLSVNAELGRYMLTVQVMDDDDNIAKALATVEVSAALMLADAPPFTVIASVAVSLHTFIASGGVGTPTYAILGGNEKEGFTLNAASGVLSLVADAKPDNYVLRIQAKDARDNTAKVVVTVGVSAVLSLADALSLGGAKGIASYLHTFAAQGGIGAWTYALLAGATEGYFSLGAESGVLSLLANASVAIYTLSVQVRDDRGNAAYALAVVDVRELFLANADLLYAIEGRTVSLHTFEAQGVNGAGTYTLVAGDERYFTLGMNSGALSVLAAPIGIYTLSVQVEDADGNQADAAAIVEVRASLSLATVPPLTVIAGRVAHTLTASSGIGTYTYAIVPGDEVGFALDAVSGVLSLSVNAGLGRHTLMMQVMDERKNTVQAVATVEVSAVLSLSDAPSFTVIASVAMSLHMFIASGGIGTPTYEIVSGDESYFSVNASSGVLSLAADAEPDTYVLSIQVTDARDNTDEAVATVGVSAVLALADTPLLTAVAEMTMSLHTFAASGGIGAKTYTLAAERQEYFTLNATSGVLSAANAAAGVYTLSVTVSDSRGNSAPARGTVEVLEDLSLADAPPLEALARLSVAVALHTFAASDGLGVKRYTLIADDSDYFALADSGELSLPQNGAMLAGTYTLSVEVSDGLTPPQRATAATTVRIIKNGIFVLGGNESQTKDNDLQNDVWWSADGESWRENTSNAGWTARETHQVVAYRGRMYLMGGFEPGVRNDVWSSMDGKNWSLVTGNAGWTARGNHQALVHNGRMYVLGGNDNTLRNDVWSSADGKNWKEETGTAAWSARQYHQAVSHNGRLYVLGGYDGSNFISDVWSSADGANWRFEGNAEWTGRWLYEAVSHNGRLYVLGGNDGGRRNDVWSSLDGRSWVEEKANNNAFWTKRGRHQALSRDGLLYVLGGNAGSLRKDVWSSSDGKNWTEETGAAGWEAREYHQALVFPPDLVLSGTSETIILALQAGLEIYPFSAQYGGGQYTYSLTPEIEGFNIDGAGVLSADGDAQAGAYALTVRVEDEEGSHAESIINIELRVLALADAPPLFVFAGLSEGVSLHAFTAVYGVGESTYELVGDASGYFTLGTASGVLSVTANVSEGVYTLSVVVSDEGGQAAAVATVKAVPILSLADAPLISVIIGRAVSLHTFTAVGGSRTKTYSLVDAPGFFTLGEASGILSVQASSEEGTYTVSVRVSDESGQAAAVAIVAVTVRLLLADAPPLFVFAGLAEGVSLHAFTVVYGVGASTYNLVDDSGYFTLGTASGVLSVTANVPVGVYTLSVEVSDERGQAAALATVAVVPILSLADAPLRSVIVGRAVSLHTFTAVGGSRTKTYNLVNAPGFFTLGEASGILSVQVVSEMGIYTVSVQVSDESGQAAAVATVAVAARLSLADASLIAVEKKAVSLHTFAASGGIGARTYTLSAGNETGYFILDASGGVLSLSASASAGEYMLTVGVKDERGNITTAVAAVNISAALSLADAPPLGAAEGYARDLHTFVASGGLGVKTYTLVAGAAYFTVGVASGVLSVDANATLGIYTLSVQAADADGNVAALALATVEVVSLFLLDAPPLYAIAGQEVSLHTFETDGGSGTMVFTIVAGNEDKYFTIDAVGVLSMQAKARGGTYTLTVAVNDEDGNRAEARAVVAVANLFLADMPLLTAFTEMTMSLHTFAAIGGIGAETYTLAAGDGQEYFTLNATSGVLSVVNASVGVYTLSVTVSDSIGSSAQARGTVQVLAFLSLADAPYLEALARLSVEVSLHTFAAGGGVGRKRYTLIASETSYFALDAASGELSLPSNSAMLAGAYTLRVEVSDSLTPPQRATAAAAVQIARNGIFVLGGNFHNGTKNDAWRSTDGKAWTRETANAGWPGRSNYQAVVHNGRMYVLGGNTGSRQNDVWSSADGKNWSFEGNAAWSARDQHQVVAYQGRLYVLGGTDGSRLNDVWSWAEGEESWKEETGSAAWTVREGHQAVVHNGRMYVLGGKDGSHKKDVWSSADGANWRFEGNAQWGTRERHQAVSHQGRLYILGGRRNNVDFSDVWSSLDGKSWRREKADGSSSWSDRQGFGALSRDGLLYVLGGKNGPYLNDVWSSVDGKSWAKVADAAWQKRQLQAVVLPPNLVLSGTSETIILPLLQGGVVVAGHTVSAQYGGGQYTYSLTPEIEGLRIDGAGALSADNQAQAGAYKITVRVEDEEGSHAETILNIELRTFALADAPPLAALARLSVTVALHTFAASGGIGSKRYTLIADQSGYFALDADSGELSLPSNSAMLVGTYTLMVEASDSLTPPQRATAAATVQIARNGIFVLGGNESQSANNDLQNDVWWSAHGETWNLVTGSANWTARELHQVVAYRGRMYLLGGVVATGKTSTKNKNDVWSSLDGKNWSLVTDSADWSARGGHQALVHNGRMYVLGGRDAVGHRNDVWSSADGKNWEEETGSADWTLALYRAVAHNGRMYVTGGYNRSDVWSSADGSSWRFEGNAAWGPRHFHQVVSHAGRLYVLGGIQGTDSYNRRNDVWSSLDGRSWVEEKANNNAFWARRDRYQALSRDGLLYVLGGNANGLKKDVWSSSDGKIWSVETLAAGWKAREYHQALLFPPNLVLSGTSETITLTMGVGAELHTFSAQYGFGEYTYLLALESESIGFDIDESSGVLSADDDAAVGGYTLTVWVEDEEGSRAETVVQVEIIAASTAALSAMEHFAWSESGGSRRDVGLSEHGDSGRREGLRRFQQAIRYQTYVLGGG